VERRSREDLNLACNVGEVVDGLADVLGAAL
jgi:hypothetical protein